MVSLGLVVGAVFPAFASALLGLSRHETYQPVFVGACLLAGFLVGALNHGLSRVVVGRRLALLSARLREVADTITRAGLSGQWTESTSGSSRIRIDSDDELGETARAFNSLLDALEAGQHARSLVHNSSDIITVVDASGVVRYQTPSVGWVLGVEPDRLVDRPLATLVHPDDRYLLHDYLDLVQTSTDVQTPVAVRMRHSSGSWRSVETAANNLLSDPAVRGIVLTTRDVSERRRLEGRLRHQAFHDSLTGLPNRALFLERVREAQAAAEVSGAVVAVLFLDLDNLKLVNDSAGHEAGDSLLVTVAARLAQQTLPADTAARLGGDEFAALLVDPATATDAPDDVGPLASLDAIEAAGSGAVLMKLAVVLPDEASEHLHRLLIDTPRAALRGHVKSRRDLVWTLEKLVWHSRLFRQAADSILRLTLAENERYANNATGLWTSLFPAVLPSTSAAPATRLTYLRAAGSADDPEVRWLAVAAAQAALHPYESVIVSGELQGGTPVEPRGGVRTLEEADEYRASLVDFLANQYHGAEAAADVRAAAAAALIGALHPLIDSPAAGAALTRALAALQPDDLPMLRAAIEQLRSLFREHPKPAVQAGLDQLEATLPPMTTLDAVRALTDLDPWTFQEEQRVDELREALDRLQADGALVTVLRWLQDCSINGAWHLGHALAHAAPGSNTLSVLVSGVRHNPAALAGYLAGQLDDGDEAAVTNFFASDAADALSLAEQLSLAVRLPATDEHKRRVLGLVEQASVYDGARLLFGWQRNLDASEVAGLLTQWLGRIAGQSDYNAVVDWVAGWFHRRTELPDGLAANVRELVLTRREHPDLGREASDWTRLAALIASKAPSDLAGQVFALVADGLTLHPETPEARLLTDMAADDPQTLWLLVAEQLVQDNWRLAMSVRGWLTEGLPVEVPIRWVGDRIDRARLVARIAAVGDNRLSPLATFLLTEFGTDDQIQNALSAEFVSGGWVGPWSGRIRHQLNLLATWDEPGAPAGVRTWTGQMKKRLNAELAEAVEREAERGF